MLEFTIVALEWSGKLQIEALLLQAALGSISNSLGIFHVACIENCHHSHHTLQGCIHFPSQHTCITSSKECTAVHSLSHGGNASLPVSCKFSPDKKHACSKSYHWSQWKAKPLFFPCSTTSSWYWLFSLSQSPHTISVSDINEKKRIRHSATLWKTN